MFGGLGGALKNLTEKTGEILDKTKTSVSEMAAEKKAAAQAMLEGQAKKTQDALFQSKSDMEQTAGQVGSTAMATATDAKQAAIDGFDREVSGVETAIDSTVQEAKKETKVEAEKAPSFALDPSMLASVVGGSGDVAKTVDTAVKQAGALADSKIKEADHFIDEKREEVVKTVQDEATKATENTSQGVGAILGKAKGFLNF